MKRAVVVAALLVACGLAAFLFTSTGAHMRAHETKEWVEFARWLVDYQKEYANEWELMERFGVFRANKHAIEAHNAEKHNWTMGINQFTDLTVKEFEEIHLNGFIVDETDDVQADDPFVPDVEVPDSMDWEARGAVNPVRNQGSCGSCWAFSSTGSLEGQYFLKYGQSKILSTQQLTDCVYSRSGCYGGYMMTAFKYWQDNGAMSESSYPYTATYGTCRHDKSQAVAKVGTRGNIARNEAALKEGASRYVLAVAAYASSWGRYSGGIFDGYCSGSANHAVTLTGYGTESGQKYWRIKNSWGSRWGDSGYIKLKRTESSTSAGQCWVANYGMWAQVE